MPGTGGRLKYFLVLHSLTFHLRIIINGNAGDGFHPWVRKIPWRRKWQPTLVFLLGKSHGRRSLAADSPGVAKSWTRLSNFTLTFHFDALEKELATHSNILAWRIPGTGERGGLPSMGSHRVGHD